MRSKFSRAPPRKKPPTICRKPPLEQLREVKFDFPRDLSASLIWIDLPPETPFTLSQQIGLLPTANPQILVGATASSGTRLHLTVSYQKPPNNWKFKLALMAEEEPTQYQTWSDVYVDPNVPFDSGLLRYVSADLSRIRQIRVLE